MGKAHFPVVASLDMGRPQEGTVTIDRDAGLFHVRVKRRRTVYTLPLDSVASMVVSRIIQAEVREKMRLKATSRKSRLKEK